MLSVDWVLKTNYLIIWIIMKCRRLAILVGSLKNPPIVKTRRRINTANPHAFDRTHPRTRCTCSHAQIVCTQGTVNCAAKGSDWFKPPSVDFARPLELANEAKLELVSDDFHPPSRQLFAVAKLTDPNALPTIDRPEEREVCLCSG